ncbi:MAG TPA: TetR/AcrR family transcriptional regulator [Gryllotalpicola sp.]
MSEMKSERIPAAQRRELILEAAGRVFGERGYAGTTTDQIAQAAGISQPYVVRMFGSKERLFVEVLDRAERRLRELFSSALVDADAQELSGAPRRAYLGRAYIDLVEESGILLPLMQAFLLGHDPAIGPRARAGFLAIFRALRDEAGFGAEEARDFLAQGMLLNTLLALQMPRHYREDPDARELLDCVFGSKIDLVLDMTKAEV